MFLEKKRKFLFKCDSCQAILMMEFDDPKDLADVTEDKILFECSCGGICAPLRD
jgi:hypothetical protein